MKTAKVWLLLTLVFVAGFAGGVITTRTLTRRVVQAVLNHPASLQGRIEIDLNRRLRLSTDQESRVHHILSRTRERLQILRREFQPRLRTVLSDSRNEISSLLTPAQQRRFEQYLSRHPLPPLNLATEAEDPE